MYDWVPDILLERKRYFSKFGDQLVDGNDSMFFLNQGFLILNNSI